MIEFDRSPLRLYAAEKDIPVVDLIMKSFSELKKQSGKNSTLLAVCPNSEAVLKAGIQTAKKANAPIKFAATLNQVDLDGGYTGWTQESFVKLVSDLTDECDFTGPVIIAVDHGGLWLKDISARDNWTLNETTDMLKVSLAAALFAGYDLIHIDPTVDKTLAPGKKIEIDTVIQRTVDLIAFTESIRRRFYMKRISYEVGTEEVHGGLADISVFRHFLSGLKSKLKDVGLSDVWPIFVVGKVGTDLDTAVFDPVVAAELVSIAGEYESYIKGHYTDYVDNPQEYPLSGMGAANVGPEFTEAEYNAITELIEIETILSLKGAINECSNMHEALKDAVVESGRWKKWLKPDEANTEFELLSKERKDWLVKTGCRYIWTHPAVKKSRNVLYRNVAKDNIDADEYVVDKISEAMMKYFNAFNLTGINDYLEFYIKRRLMEDK